MKRHAIAFAIGITTTFTFPGYSQTLPTPDSTLSRIWVQGMDSSHTYQLAQTLMDSIGPRLTGSTQQRSGVDWLIAMYTHWGIPARKEQYGTWKGWRRGYTHIDLVAPRVRTLEGMMLAWSPGTKGKDVEGEAVALPAVGSSEAFTAWLSQVKGKYVLVSYPQPTCRPDSNWKIYATPESFQAMQALRQQGDKDWQARSASARSNAGGNLRKRLEDAGVAGLLSSNWSEGWGVNKVFQTGAEKVPALDLSCEDYGLVYRLAENNQHPRVRVNADADLPGETPVWNAVAEIRGTEKPDEYVMLSAHFDSWDGSSGATDNGTGTVTMLEVMRILKMVYPHPKRTILVGHWSGEEQGINGSQAFVADHPEIPSHLQALFNQDEGTGRVTDISMQGLTQAGDYFNRWFGRMPTELTKSIRIITPGQPDGGGSDHAAFVCGGAPAFELSSLGWDYDTYTWHTNRDTFDKIVFDDLKRNATLIAMLAYLASEEPTLMPRQMHMSNCRQPQRASPSATPPRSTR